MANSSFIMTQSRRRPKRQRTPTTIYTDDNPTTFTTKKKKGQNHNRDNDDDGSRRSSTGNSSLDSRSWSEMEESISMPPPAPVVRRGRGRPPSRRKSAEKFLAGMRGGRTGASTATSTATESTKKKTTVSNSSPNSSSEPLSTAKASLAVGTEPSSTVVTKRKRGRPPKNRPKEVVAVNPSTVESDSNSKIDAGTKPSNETVEGKAINDSLTTDSQVDDPVVNISNDAGTNRRLSLPESSSEPEENEKGRRRLSLDTLLSSKREMKCSIISKSGTKVGSTRISNIKRRTKAGASKLLFRARANSSTSWTPPHQDIEGTFINHAVTVAPILPTVILCDNDDGNNANKTNDDRREKTRNDDDTSHIVSESSAIRRELQSKYPVVFDKGVPKASSCIAPPFSSTSQISSGASSASSSKHKSNQSQNQLSQLPTWSPLYKPPVFFEEDYDQETGNLNIENTIPVTRHITAMTVRKPDHDYLVLGDSVGFVIVYSLAKDNITLPIAQLESTACSQRAKEEQERLRDDLRKRKKQPRGGTKGGNGSNKSSSLKFSNSSRPGTHNQMHNPFALEPQHGRSIVIDTSDTTIHALGMIKSRVVLATSQELECMDVPSGTSLWVCPLSSNRFVTSLDMHLNTFDVLVSCTKTIDSTEAVAAPVSPLMLLQHSKDNVEICDANSPMLVRSPSCSAIWDIGASNRLLFIALSANRQEHELVLVSGGSIDSWKVACKTKIPTRASSSVAAAAKLSQSPGGMYTLVASSRGIRLYQTESLQLIHVYGDQLALHGQSVMWKDCWLAGSFFSEKNKNVTKAARGLLQCDDWLGEMIGETTNGNSAKRKNASEDNKDEKAPNLAPYIIGVPHTKGPKELCENLHVWKVEHPSVVPMMSIPLPHKAEGALGLVGSGNKSRSNNAAVTEDRIVLVTNDGEGHLLLPKMESDFAGISYPPGYQVVTDNIEYIEDEEATDDVVAGDELGSKNNSEDEAEDVDITGQGDDDESMDEELREAMRQSLLEHKKNGITLEMMEYDEEVDILGTDGEKDMEFLPCRPEPYLRQMVNAVVEVEETSDSEMKEEGVKLDVAINGTISGLNGIDENISSSNVAMKPKLTDDTFISSVLEIMPNMPKIKPLEEDCLSFTTTKVVVAVNPVVQKRGRKSRAANLETLLKASINPYLKSMMLSRQGVPVNGNGSKLRASRPSSKHKLKSSSGSFSEATESKHDVGTERVNGESYSCDSSASGLNIKPSSSPRHATNEDEAAVVMGLLGLSPCHTSNVQSNTFVSSDSKEVPVGASAANGPPKGSAYLSSSSLSLLGERNGDNQVVSALSSERGSAAEGSENMVETTGRTKLDIVDKSCSACRGRLVIHTCGRRALPIDYEEIARAERDRKEKEEEEKKRIRAEKRRLADKKRKEAKQQKQRELEEQRLREENERLEAEQRRRLQEHFAAQDLNRNRREQIVASYANHVSANPSHQTDATTETHPVEYSRNQTVEVTSSSYSNDHHNQFFQPQTSINDVAQQGTRIAQQHTPNGQACVTHQCHPPDNSQYTTASNEHAEYSVSSRSPSGHAAPAASSNLQYTDALTALANLADFTETLPETGSRGQGFGTPSNEPACAASGNGTSYTRERTVNQYNIPAFGASHGFSVQSNANDTVSSGEVKRGIPSYASIRGDQCGNGSPNDVASAMTPTSSLHNGYTQRAGESLVFSWPARSNDRD